jgi:hypothetical protein
MSHCAARPRDIGIVLNTGFKHSQLNTFEARGKCRLCDFVWSSDLMSHVDNIHRVRGLYDLLKLFEERPAYEDEKAWVVFKAIINKSADVRRSVGITLLLDRDS